MPDDTSKKDKPDWYDNAMEDMDKGWKKLWEPEDKKKPDSGDNKKKPE